jgi:peptidyl-tRNA hydrolase
MSNALKVAAAVAGIAAVGAATYYGLRKYEDHKFNKWVDESHGKAKAKVGGVEEFKTTTEKTKEDGKVFVKTVSVRETADATTTIATHATQNRKLGMNMASTLTVTVPKVEVKAKPVVKHVTRKPAAKTPAVKTAAKRTLKKAA